MSLTSEELNYLIYRYLQESGRELTALCLQEESRVLEFEEKFHQHIPVGYLVSIVQKGIMYSEAELMVDYDGTVNSAEDNVARYQKHFTLAQALKIDSKKCAEVKSTGRFALLNDPEADKEEAHLASEIEKSIEAAKDTKDGSEETTHAEKTVATDINDGSDKSIGDVDMDSQTKNSNTPQGQPTYDTEKFEPQTPTDEILSLSPCFSFAASNFCEFSSTFKFAYSDKNSLVGESKIATYLPDLGKFSDDQIALHHINNADPLNASLAVASGLSLTNIGNSCPATCLAWSESGDTLITGVQSGELRIWTADGTLNNVLNLHKSAIVSIKWSPNSVYCLTMDIDNIVVVWNTFSGTPIQHFNLKEIMNNYHYSEEKEESLGVDCCWIEADKFVIPGLNGAILLFEVDTTGASSFHHSSNPNGRLLGHTKTITYVEYDEPSKMLLSCSDDCSIRVWRGNNSNFRNLFSGHQHSVVNASWFNLSNFIISSSLDGTVKVWSTLPQFKNSELVTSIMDGTPIVYACISYDKKSYAIGRADAKVIVYDLEKLSTSLNELDTKSNISNTDLMLKLAGLEIPIKAEYCNSSIEPNTQVYITSMAWSKDNSMLGVSYDQGESKVLKF